MPLDGTTTKFIMLGNNTFSQTLLLSVRRGIICQKGPPLIGRIDYGSRQTIWQGRRGKHAAEPCRPSLKITDSTGQSTRVKIQTFIQVNLNRPPFLLRAGRGGRLGTERGPSPKHKHTQQHPRKQILKKRFRGIGRCKHNGKNGMIDSKVAK